MVTWEIESKVRNALQGVTPPSGCPPGRLFLPEGLRADVIRWGHASKVTCHPGVNRTILVDKQWFWWHSMARDIRDFVWPVPFLPVVRLPIDLQKVSSNRCQSLRDPGPTSL